MKKLRRRSTTTTIIAKRTMMPLSIILILLSLGMAVDVTLAAAADDVNESNSKTRRTIDFEELVRNRHKKHWNIIHSDDVEFSKEIHSGKYILYQDNEDERIDATAPGNDEDEKKKHQQYQQTQRKLKYKTPSPHLYWNDEMEKQDYTSSGLLYSKRPKKTAAALNKKKRRRRRRATTSTYIA